MLSPWIKLNYKWSNRRWQEWTSTFRNQWTKMNWNGWIWSLGLPGPKGTPKSFPRDHVDMKGWVGIIWKSDRERQKGTGDREATERHMWHDSLKSGFWLKSVKDWMQGNSEPFLCFWQKLLCHSQAIVSGSPSICIGPSLFQGQNFPVSESVDRSEF